MLCQAGKRVAGGVAGFQRAPPTAQVGEFPAQDAAGRALESVDDLSNTEGQVRLDAQMHMLWHHRHRVKRNDMLAGNVAEDLLEAGIEGIGQHGPAEFPADNDVVLPAEGRPGVHPIAPARFHGLGVAASRVEFERGTPIRGPDFLCQLKQAGSNRSLL